MHAFKTEILTHCVKHNEKHMPQIDLKRPAQNKSNNKMTFDMNRKIPIYFRLTDSMRRKSFERK